MSTENKPLGAQQFEKYRVLPRKASHQSLQNSTQSNPRVLMPYVRAHLNLETPYTPTRACACRKGIGGTPQNLNPLQSSTSPTLSSTP